MNDQIPHYDDLIASADLLGMGAGLYACSRCGAAVVAGYEDKHTTFHLNVDRVTARQ